VWHLVQKKRRRNHYKAVILQNLQQKQPQLLLNTLDLRLSTNFFQNTQKNSNSVQEERRTSISLRSKTITMMMIRACSLCLTSINSIMQVGKTLSRLTATCVNLGSYLVIVALTEVLRVKVCIIRLAGSTIKCSIIW
jgi:ABC-type anion transport system duplicated permease subunit